MNSEDNPEIVMEASGRRGKESRASERVGEPSEEVTIPAVEWNPYVSTFRNETVTVNHRGIRALLDKYAPLEPESRMSAEILGRASLEARRLDMISRKGIISELKTWTIQGFVSKFRGPKQVAGPSNPPPPPKKAWKKRAQGQAKPKA